MKITIEIYADKFTYESEYNSPDMTELTEKLYSLCIAAGYHADTVGECFFEKGREATEHLYLDDYAEFDDHAEFDDDNNSMIDGNAWEKIKEDKMEKEPYTESPGYNAKHASSLALESRINKDLAKMRLEEIIKLGNENHEQRGQMALLREEIKELYKENVELQIEADTMRQHHKNAEAVCADLQKDKSSS